MFPKGSVNQRLPPGPKAIENGLLLDVANSIAMAGPITPSPLRFCWKTGSNDSNAGLVPDVGLRRFEMKVPSLLRPHTPYESPPVIFQARSYPLAVCSRS